MNKPLLSILALMFAMLFVSCSGNVPPMQRDYPDAVTNINQVDPYYRAYFRRQNASNYTLSDQRRAYLAAVQTARTPVRASDYTRAVNSRRLAQRSGRKAATNRRAIASRKAGKGKKPSARRAVARRGTKAKANTKAKSRRATARRSNARRGTRRRG